MGEKYQNKIFYYFSKLQQDLRNKKIDEEQFKFLLGLCIKIEFNKLIKDKINSILLDESYNQKTTWLMYQKYHRCL